MEDGTRYIAIAFHAGWDPSGSTKRRSRSIRSKGEDVSEQSIDRGRERFLEAWLTNDADALMRELADDVVFMPPGQEPARGKAAVRGGEQVTARGSFVTIWRRDDPMSHSSRTLRISHRQPFGRTSHSGADRGGR